MQPKAKGMILRVANGAELKYHGTKNTKFQIDGRGGVCDMKFDVTYTTKPLATAATIAKMGNRVVFVDGPGKAYIETVATGKRNMLRESGGTYILNVGLIEGPGFNGRE